MIDLSIWRESIFSITYIYVGPQTEKSRVRWRGKMASFFGCLKSSWLKFLERREFFHLCRVIFSILGATRSQIPITMHQFKSKFPTQRVSEKAFSKAHWFEIHSFHLSLFSPLFPGIWVRTTSEIFQKIYSKIFQTWLKCKCVEANNSVDGKIFAETSLFLSSLFLEIWIAMACPKWPPKSSMDRGSKCCKSFLLLQSTKWIYRIYLVQITMSFFSTLHLNIQEPPGQRVSEVAEIFLPKPQNLGVAVHGGKSPQ